MMSSSRIFPAATLALFAALTGQLHADTLIAGKAPVTLSLTVAQTIGGYKLTFDKQDSEAVKGIYYGGLMNPINFNDEQGFNYLSERSSEVTKKLGSDVLPVEKITQVVKTTLVEKYLNANFIADLITLGKVTATAGKTPTANYTLVAVTFKGFDDNRRFYFVENLKLGTTLFVGWEKRPGEADTLTSGMYLYTEVADGVAEAGTQKTSQKVTYDKIDSTTYVETIDQPAPTLTDTFSGKGVLTLRVFPAGTASFRDYRLTGKATASGRYDTKQLVYVNGKVAGTALIGSQIVTYGEGELTEEHPEAVVEGSITIGAEALLVGKNAAETDAKARVYWNALPSGLRAE